ncbi:MAG: HPr family phosphocarrier protein [Clostridiales bacterium]|nr:HPr family phosphocarrier protein [Clostridiales bacterium]
MKSIKISLSSINDVRDFVDVVRKYDMEIDLSSGRYVVDAKSIMGIFSLDLLKPITLTAYSDNTEKLFEELDKYVIKE